MLRMAAGRANPNPANPTAETPRKEPTPANVIFSSEEILDESTLDVKTLQDWHPVGASRQKPIEINVAHWWPGQDYRIRAPLTSAET